MRIRKFFGEVIELTDDALLDKVCSFAEVVEIKKNTVLVRQGEVQKNISLILEGVYRGFYVDVNGKEITDCLGFRCGEPAMACMRMDFPSEITIEAVTDGQCLQLPIQEMLNLSRHYPELEMMYNNLLLQGISRHSAIKKVMKQFDAMGRYQWFLEAYPGLIDVVSHKDITSFIGITPVSLSRLRRTLQEKDEESL